MKLLAQKVNQVLLVPILITVILYYGRPILIPVFFAIILAMLMAPLCSAIDRKGIPRAISSLVSVLILVAFIVLFLLLISMQLASFLESMELIKERTDQLIAGVQNWLQLDSWLAPDSQNSIRAELTERVQDYLSGSFAGSLGTTIGNTAIVIVFTFLLLYHKEKYHQFFLRLIKGADKPEVEEALGQIAKVSQHYLVGRLLSILFLFAMYCIALLVIGIKNAILLSAVAALLTIVPYIGPFVGGFFPVMTAFVTETSLEPAIWTLIALIVIQALDNYFVEPNVVGGEVNLTAFSTILAILAGGILWGISGMILFIPLLSIAKIIFDHVDILHPYGYVIGDEGPSPSSMIGNLFRNLFHRS